MNAITLEIIFVSEKAGKKLFGFLKEPKRKQKLFDEFGRDVIVPLLEENILVVEDSDDMQYLAEVRQKLLGKISLELMYLLVTDYCNLQCRYCFEETPVLNKKFKPVYMTQEIAKKAIDLFVKFVDKYGNPRKKKIIHLYGGEPLLNPNIVKFAVLYAEKLKKEKSLSENYEIAIVTNGVLLDEELATFFAEHRVTVGLSIDGPKDINNVYRVAKKQEFDVFDKITKAYALLKKHQVRVGLSVTLTPLAVKQFDRLLKFFTDEFGILNGISLNLLHYNRGVLPAKSYYPEAAKCQIRAFEKFRELGIYEERVMRKAQAFVDCRAIYADCGVVGNQLVIAPDGQIGVCHDFVKPRTYFHGSVFDEDIGPIASGLFREWRKRSPLFMEQCFDCEAIGICGGGCPASVELKTGNRWNIDERICPHSRLILEWLIWDAYSHLAEKLVL